MLKIRIPKLEKPDPDIPKRNAARLFEAAEKLEREFAARLDERDALRERVTAARQRVEALEAEDESAYGRFLRAIYEGREDAARSLKHEGQRLRKAREDATQEFEEATKALESLESGFDELALVEDFYHKIRAIHIHLDEALTYEERHDDKRYHRVGTLRDNAEAAWNALRTNKANVGRTQGYTPIEVDLRDVLR